jgi:hypothetical protein
LDAIGGIHWNSKPITVRFAVVLKIVCYHMRHE